MFAVHRFRLPKCTIKLFHWTKTCQPRCGFPARVYTRRCIHTTTVSLSKPNLWDEYHRLKSIVEAKPLPSDRDPFAVYANNELRLRDIDVYGFDYDYTVACYNENLDRIIYNLGRASLVRDYKYPRDIENRAYDYDPSFAVRGLHCDVEKGYLLKIDSFHCIQKGTVYRGLQPVSDADIVQNYSGSHVAIENISGFYGTGPKMHQLMDMFALPEMTLYANVIEFFNNNDITYCPEHVFYDVRTTVQKLHSTGEIHQIIMDNLDTYLVRENAIVDMLTRLASAGKKLFLITNSSTQFVDRGMTYLVGPQWTELFDVIITNARKPKFFFETNRPFRSYDHKLGVKSWNKVDKLDKGSIYLEGNIHQLINLTGWAGSRVLYIGDHVYTDLADATLKLGWRTGAIIRELEDEINTVNTETFKKSITWLLELESLISRMQIHQDPESLETLVEWIKERAWLRQVTKEVFNKRFGSLFRTYHNPTYFTRRLNRFADVYTSSLVNLLNYPLTYTFYPQRAALPHELP